jgi:hypothetical protein
MRKGEVNMETIKIPISPGELLDKITILEIKSEHIEDAEKRRSVQYELKLLTTAQQDAFKLTDTIADLKVTLKSINQTLWTIEDDIRECERQKDFGNTFIELARSVYKTNDERARVKREINHLLGSAIQEEKSYAAY